MNSEDFKAKKILEQIEELIKCNPQLKGRVRIRNLNKKIIKKESKIETTEDNKTKKSLMVERNPSPISLG